MGEEKKALRRRKRLGICESFLSLFSFYSFSDLNDGLSLEAESSVNLTKKDCAVNEYVELGR